MEDGTKGRWIKPPPPITSEPRRVRCYMGNKPGKYTPHQGAKERRAVKIPITADEAGVELLALLRSFEGTKYQRGHVQQVIRDYFYAHEFTDGADPQTILDRILAPSAAAAGKA